MSDNQESLNKIEITKKNKEDFQEPPPGTVETEGTPCWKCNGTGYLTRKNQKRECNVCKGNTKIISEVRKKLFHQPGRVMEERRWPENSIIPGPICVGEQNNELLHPHEGEALCSLSGHWKIFQRLGGHRFSTDDVITAWCTSQFIMNHYNENQMKSIHYLDIGCGLGSVLLFIAWKFEMFKCTGIEAQTISYNLAKRSILYNIGNSDRIQVYNGDLRDFSVLPESPKSCFQIITGTPPYFKSGKAALPSKVDQKACLFEFRGGVEEYCKSASHYLTEDGHFFVVESYLCRERIDQGANDAGLKIIERWDIIPKEDKSYLICVAHLCKRPENEPLTEENNVFKKIKIQETKQEEIQNNNHNNQKQQKKPKEPKFKIVYKENYPLHIITIRNKNDQYTAQYNTILQDMGFPPQKNVGN